MYLKIKNVENNGSELFSVISNITEFGKDNKLKCLIVSDIRSMDDPMHAREYDLNINFKIISNPKEKTAQIKYSIQENDILEIEYINPIDAVTGSDRTMIMHDENNYMKVYLQIFIQPITNKYYKVEFYFYGEE